MAPPSRTEKEETRKFIDKSKPPKRPYSIRFSIEILRLFSLCTLVALLPLGQYITESFIFFPEEDTPRTLEQDTTGLRGTEHDAILNDIGEERNLLSLFGHPLEPYIDRKETTINKIFGFLHACSFIDYNPAKEIAALLLPFISYPLCLFLILDYFRIRVSFGNKLVPELLYKFSKFSTPIALLLTSMIHLWFVNNPDKTYPEGYGFIAHYLPYVGFQVALALIAIQQVWYHIALDNIPFGFSPTIARIYLKLAVFLPLFYQMCVFSILLERPIFDSLKGGEEGTWERVVFKALTRIYPLIAMGIPIICSFWEAFVSKDPNKYTTFTIEID